MKRSIITFALLIFLYPTFSFTQSTALRVYEIFQEKCVNCHDHASPQSGLDLEGSGATVQDRLQEVYNNIVNVTADNSYAASKGYDYIVPGRADRSFIFRKINLGLEPTITPESGEGQSMPPYGSPTLDSIEKELIRQWILYGAPETGMVIDEQLIHDYYTANGMPSFPDGPPEAPDPSEGFQIKMGPFYLEPGGEIEYFQKHQLGLPEDIDVNRIDIKMSSFSHHFILYDYSSPAGASSVPEGYREWINHTPFVGITATVQEPTSLKLPQGTAFKWDKDVVLDLNSHYINYSAAHTYQAEVYLNIYTQPAGTAAQEMHAELVPNFNIPIPNNGNPVTHSGQVTAPAEIFVWILGGHTHRYGTGYKIWEVESPGVQGDLLYDGSCPQGVPGCISPFFDYQHIPPRYFEPLLPVDMEKGLYHEATWINDGPEPVSWGPTSEDEMMLFGMFYVTDTTGLGVVTGAKEVQYIHERVEVYPNPFGESTTIIIPDQAGIVDFILYDATGSMIQQITELRAKQLVVQGKDLIQGLYFFRLQDEDGRMWSGKMMVEK